MDDKAEVFVAIHDWMILDLHLKGAKLIIYAIIYQMSMHGKRSRYDGGLEHLMQWSACTKRGVIDALKSLIEDGLITKKEVSAGRGHYCEYRATAFDKIKGEVSSVKGEVSSLKGKVSSPKYIDNIKEEVSKDKSLDTGAQREAEFEVFWKAYPKKKDKAKARKSFFKVKTPLTTLLAALEAQKRTEQWQKDNGQFIPLPTTWLNGERWEDEVGPITTTPEPERPKQRVFKGTRINEYGEEENVYEWV